MLNTAYKAFYMKVMEERKGTDLSKEEAKAIGAKVMNDLIQPLFKRHNLTRMEREQVEKEVWKIISEEFPDNLLNTNLIFNGNKFKKKGQSG